MGWLVTLIIVCVIFGVAEAVFEVIQEMWKRSPAAFVTLVCVAMVCLTAFYIANTMITK